jgi:hypothetical protein
MGTSTLVPASPHLQALADRPTRDKALTELMPISAIVPAPWRWIQRGGRNTRHSNGGMKPSQTATVPQPDLYAEESQ